MLEMAPIIPIVTTAAERFEINRFIIQALIIVESSGNPKAARHERQFTYLCDPAAYAKALGITEETERIFQKTSWGLMQVMGGTARDMGFSGALTDLLDPTVGIEWGCRYFLSRCSEYETLLDQIAAYNAGSVRRIADGSYRNQSYVDKVIEALTALTSTRQRSN